MTQSIPNEKVDERDEMPSVSQIVPPFPDYLPSAALIELDFDLLAKHDPTECQRLFAACKEKRFFYLRNHHVDTDTAFQFGKELYDMPIEEEKYLMGDGGAYIGYRKAGSFIADKKGTP